MRMAKPEQKSVVEEAVMMAKTTIVVPKSGGTGCSNQLGILLWLPDDQKIQPVRQCQIALGRCLFQQSVPLLPSC